MGAMQIPAAVPRRFEALAYIIERIERTYTSPSFGEIGGAMNPPVSEARARQYVDQLVRLELLERPIASRRGIRVPDLARCRGILAQVLGLHDWRVAQPLGELTAPPYTSEQLPLLPLIRHHPGAH